jgi:FMN phosphatase YigB (HAD superfamily)
MKKKIIFFDGDGTLWYPKKTKYKEGPWWVYKLPGSPKEHNKHFIMTPSTLQTIKKLKRKGILLIVLSTHPHPPKEADAVINQKIKHFKLEGLFDEIIATRDKGPYKYKGKVILKILKKRKIPKSKALMIGDSYHWDYKPAKDVGIDALLIESEYMKKHAVGKRIKNTITKLSDIFDYIS